MKRKRVAETARETIKTAEGRTGAPLRRGRRRPDFAILPDFRRRKRGAGRVFRTSASEKTAAFGRRGASLARRLALGRRGARRLALEREAAF